MLNVGCWMLDVGCWMLDVGCWMLDVKSMSYIKLGHLFYSQQFYFLSQP